MEPKDDKGRVAKVIPDPMTKKPPTMPPVRANNFDVMNQMSQRPEQAVYNKPEYQRPRTDKPR